MKKKKNYYIKRAQKSNSSADASDNLSDENRQLLSDMLKIIMSKEQFKEQNAEAKEFFEKAVFRINGNENREQ